MQKSWNLRLKKVKVYVIITLRCRVKRKSAPQGALPTLMSFAYEDVFTHKNFACKYQFHTAIIMAYVKRVTTRRAL